MSESILKIEKKVPLAADAALLINGYLEELNEKLVFSGTQEVYSIVNDTEEIIVEMLKNLQSSTKLGSDVVIELIHDKLGTPGEFVRQYLYDVNSTLVKEELRVDYDSNQLVRRGGDRNDIRHTHETDPFNSSKYIVFLPIVLIIINLFMHPRYNHIELISIVSISIVITGIATAIYILIEIESALNGETRLSVRNSIRMRSLFNGLIIFNLGMYYWQLSSLKSSFERYLVLYFQYEYQGQPGRTFYVERIAHLQNVLNMGIAFFLVLQIVILYRDHKSGLYPLENDFKPLIRFATLSYILLISSIIMLMLAILNYQFYVFAQILAAGAGIWAYVSRTPVTYRFHILVIAVLVIVELFEGYLLAYPYLFIMLILTRLFRIRERKEENWWRPVWSQKVLMSIYTRLQAYYNQEVI